MSNRKATPELHVAEQIVGVLPAGSVVRVCSDDRDSIRFAVRTSDLKLRLVILSRSSLRRLVDDPAGAVKIEYLQRDLGRSATRRAEFRYPRELRRTTKRSRRSAAGRRSVLASVL